MLHEAVAHPAGGHLVPDGSQQHAGSGNEPQGGQERVISGRGGHGQIWCFEIRCKFFVFVFVLVFFVLVTKICVDSVFLLIWLDGWLFCSCVVIVAVSFLVL